jgi:hypothetical protein
MLDKGEDFSMLLARAGGIKLITRDTALMMAHAAIEHVYGREELEAQLPFIVNETDETWMIEGSRRPAFPNEEEIDRQVRDEAIAAISGKAQVTISKYNGRILKFIVNATFPAPRPGEPGYRPKGS